MNCPRILTILYGKNIPYTIRPFEKKLLKIWYGPQINSIINKPKPIPTPIPKPISKYVYIKRFADYTLRFLYGFCIGGSIVIWEQQRYSRLSSKIDENERELDLRIRVLNRLLNEIKENNKQSDDKLQYLYRETERLEKRITSERELSNERLSSFGKGRFI